MAEQDHKVDPLLDDDDKPIIVKRYKSIIVSVCSFILITEMCERLAYYGLVGSLTIFFTSNLNLDTVFATQMNSLFSSVNYITPLIGAYLADTRWGRYKTILWFCVLYIAGMAGCTLSAYPGLFTGTPEVSDLGSTAQIVFLISLFLGVALGSGGIKPNVVTLGADQFDLRDPEQVAEKDRFFNYFYWSINIGATFAYGFLANLAVNGIGAISKADGFFYSFLIPSIAMGVALLTFVWGTPRYKMLPPEGSALSRFFAVFMAGCKASKTGMGILAGCLSIILGMVFTVGSYFVQDDNTQSALAIVAMCLIAFGCVAIVSLGQTTDWVDKAKEAKSAQSATFQTDVSDAKEVCRLLPYLCFLIMFWACYGQMSNNYILQGCKMNLHWNAGTDGGQMSSAFLNIFDSAVIITMIPLFDSFLYPAVEKCKGSKFTVLQKIGTGFFFCFLAMVMAGIIEIIRKEEDNLVFVPDCCATGSGFMCDPYETLSLEYGMGNDVNQGDVPGCFETLSGVFNNCSKEYVEDNLCPYNSACASDDSVMNMAKITVYAQIPQYLLVGTGEIFTAISTYELFYTEVPASMRSVCQALNLLTTSIGFMVTGGINSMFKSWIPNDIDDGEVQNVFFFVAGLTIITLAAYVYVARGFQYKDESTEQESLEVTNSGYTPDVMSKIRSRSKAGNEEAMSLLQEERRAANEV